MALLLIGAVALAALLVSVRPAQAERELVPVRVRNKRR
jgi:hypothetical protein